MYFHILIINLHVFLLIILKIENNIKLYLDFGTIKEKVQFLFKIERIYEKIGKNLI